MRPCYAPVTDELKISVLHNSSQVGEWPAEDQWTFESLKTIHNSLLSFSASETDLPRAIKLSRVNVTPKFHRIEENNHWLDHWNDRHEKCQISHKSLNVGKYKVIITGYV